MSISFSGLASGLDTSSWVKSLVALKQAKVTVLQEEREQVALSRDTLTSIKSFFSSFRSVLEKVTDTRFNIATMDIFAQNLATSANLDVLTASATTEAEEGVYQIGVNQIATNTKATSSFNYRTIYQETTLASLDSKLTDMGATAGSIGVTVNGVEYGLEIEENDTVLDFIEKLSGIGVNASYNVVTGIFSVDVSTNAIRDLDGTNIINALHLEGVNEGYESGALQVENVQVTQELALGSTKLVDLWSDNGQVQAGNIIVEANGGTYTFTIDNNTTIDSLIADFATKNITATFENGYFSLYNAEITSDGATNLIGALGLTNTVSSNTQSSNALSYETIITVSTVATTATKLSELGEGITVNNGDTVIVKDSNGEYTTITLNSNSSVGDLLTAMSNAGLNATIDSDGIVEIVGGTITGGSFNAIDALNLNSEAFTAMATGDALTETVEVFEKVTLQTRLVDDLHVTEGYVEVTDSEGRTQYLKVYSGQTIDDLMQDLVNFGLGVDFDSENGTLAITGGSFETLSDTDVLALIADNKIAETQSRYKHGSDLLTALYGAASISLEQTEVAGTYSRTRALYRAITNTIAATNGTTLGNLSLSAEGTAVFEVYGESRTINVTKADTIDSLMNKLSAVGIESSFDTIHSQLTIENAVLKTTGTSDLDDILNMTETISGKYISSNNLYTTEHVTATVAVTTESTGVVVHNYTEYAGMESLISDYITMPANKTIYVRDAEGATIGTVNTEGKTFQAVFDELSSLGVQGTIADGVVSLTSNNGNYAEGAVLTAMGIETLTVTETIRTTVGTAVSGSAVTHSQTYLADMTSTVADFATESAIVIHDNEGTSIGVVNTSDYATFEDLFAKLSEHGIQGTIADGVITLTSNDGRYATGTVLSAMGISTTLTPSSTTVTTGATLTSGSVLKHDVLVYAGMSSLVKDFASTGTITVYDKEGNATGSVTVGNNTSFEDMFQALSSYNIQGTISDGVVTLTSNNGSYALGTPLTNMGITTVSTTTKIETTSGITTTGAVVQYTTTTYTTTFPTITQTVLTTASIVVTEPVIGTQTLTISDTYTYDDVTLGTKTITVTDTYTIAAGDIDSSGVVTVTHTHTCTEAVIGTEDITITHWVTETIAETREVTTVVMFSTNAIGEYNTTEVVKTGQLTMGISQTSSEAIYCYKTVDITSTEAITYSTDVTVGISATGTAVSVQTVSSGTVAKAVTSTNFIYVTSSTSATAGNISGNALLTSFGYEVGDKISYTGYDGNYTFTVTSTSTIYSLQSHLQYNFRATVSYDPTDKELNATLSQSSFYYTDSNTNTTWNYKSTSKSLNITFNPSGTSVLVASTATAESTFVDMGVNPQDADFRIVDYDGNIVTTISIDTGIATVEDLDNELGQYGSVSISNGKVTITMSDGYYLEDNNLTAQEVLECTYLYSQIPSGMYTTGTITTTELMTEDTKVSAVVGSISNGTVFCSVVSGGTEYAITCGNTTTMGEIIDQLEAKGFTASITNGVLTVTGKEGVYISDYQGGIDMGNTFGLGDDYDYYYTVDEDVTKTVDKNTTLAQLGMSSNGGIVCYNTSTGAYVTHTVTPTMPIGAVEGPLENFSSATGSGISFDMSNGIITMSASGNWVIYDISDNLVDAFNLNRDSMLEQTTITESTTVDELSNYYGEGLDSCLFTVVSDGETYTYTTSGTDTIGDILSWFEGKGFTAYVQNGKITINGNDNCYIKDFDDDWASIIGVDDGDGTSYTVYDGYQTITFTGSTTTPVSFSQTITYTEYLGFRTNTLVLTNTITVPKITQTVVTHQTKTTHTIASTNTNEIVITVSDTFVVQTVETISATDTVSMTFTVENTTTKPRTITVYGTGVIETTTWKVTPSTDTYNIDGTIKLSQINTAFSSGTISGYCGDDAFTVNVTANDTVNDMLTALAGFGISGEVTSDGKIKLTGTDYGFITSISSSLKSTIGYSSVTNFYQSVTTTIAETANTVGTIMSSVTANVTADTDTKLGDIKNSTSTIASTDTMEIKVVDDGTEYRITFKASNTIDDVLSSLAGYGIGGHFVDGKLYLKPTAGSYITSFSSKLANALQLDISTLNTSTSTTITAGYSTTSDIQDRVTTIAMSTETQLSQRGITDPLGIVVNHEGKDHTVLCHPYMTVGDVLQELAGYGISGHVSDTGVLTLTGTNDSYISVISPSLATALGISNDATDYWSSTVTTTTIGVNTTSEFQNRTYTVAMTTSSTLEEIYNYTGLSNADGTITVNKDGKDYTVNVTKDMTISDIINALSAYGISGTIEGGKLELKGADGSYVKSMSDNVKGALKLQIGEDYSYDSSLTTILQDITMETTLGKLTNGSKGNLSITNGDIYVYDNGTRVKVNISTNDTIADLAAKLSPYGIDVVLDANGKLHFEGDNDSYLEDCGGSNILTALNINAGQWNTSYDSTSEVLSYEVDGVAAADGDTAITDLVDENGNSLGITAGTYAVYSRGVRTEEEITDDTTVDDFISTIATYGLIGSQGTDGSISVGADHNSYLATSVTSGDDTNLFADLFEEWNFVNVYTTKGLVVPEDVTVAVSETTRLADINEGAYIAGKITVIKDGVQTDIELTADDTLGTLLDELALHGFEGTINDSGQLILKANGDSLLQAYAGAGASNILDILGVSALDWISTKAYQSDELVSVVTTSTQDTAMTRDSLLSELGITTGEYYIWQNGVKHTALISSDETLGSFLDTLSSYGINANIVDHGTFSTLEIIGSGDSYVETSNSVTNRSNVIGVLFPNVTDKVYNYTAEMKTEKISTTYANATEDLALSYYDNGTNTAAGDLVVNIDGVNNIIKITADDTFQTLIEKFNALGIEASLNNGTFLIQSAYKELFIDEANSTSDLITTLGLTFNNDLGGYSASALICEQTVTIEEDVELSVANYADLNTQMKLLNISSGTLSIFRNGQRATINVEEDETFGRLRDRVRAEFADVDIRFQNGHIEFYSTTGQSVEVGATTDTSNIAAICGLTNEKTGSVKSSRELYKVNGDSDITTSGLFRRGDVTEGTFVVGNETFEINENTTLQNIIGQINASEDANATAYWDSVDGKLVIKSRTTGSSFINIEAGTSNFTDVMGYTTSTWDGSGNVEKTQLDVNLQDVGDNAVFTINGTTYSSTSNNVGSDITRITGVTINLKNVSAEGETVELKIEKDKESVANAVSDIVDAYNELMENVNKEIAKDGQLHDQSTLKLIRNQIRSLMTNSLMGTSVFRNLDAIGIGYDAASANNIDTSRVDVLSFNKDKFLSAFDSDLDSLKTLLVGNNTVTGVFTQVENVIEQAVAGASGYFASADRSYGNQISRLDSKIEKAQKAVERYQARLEAKFSAMDLLIANIQNQYSSFLS